MLLDLWILRDVCICLGEAEGRIKVDGMWLVREAGPKGEGMAAAQSILRTFFGRFRHDSIILITPYKHYDLLIIRHGCKHGGTTLDTALEKQGKSRGRKDG